MHLTEEDIEVLTKKHSERLRSALGGLPEGTLTISEMQTWMIRTALKP